jgi:hypothetical protein
MQGVKIGEEFVPSMNVTTDAEIERYIRETAVQLIMRVARVKWAW